MQQGPFYAQIVVITAIVVVSLYNLTFCDGKENLWITLLASAFGYMMPNPKMKLLKEELEKQATAEPSLQPLKETRV